jgi:predicted MFS family arabinose efflux permease
LLANVVLGPLADRVPRRGLLVGGDLIRAGLLAVMALPNVSVVLLATLLSLAVLVGAPCSAAEAALVVDILPGSDYVVGTGLRTATVQGAQLAGFAVGGVAVAAIGSSPALAVDAATFVVSALVIGVGVRPRPAPSRRSRNEEPLQGWWSGAGAVFRNRRLRQLLGLAWLLGLLVVPEGLAAPYADRLGGGPRTVGVLLAALPAGVLLGSVVYARWVGPARRAALLGPLAVAAGVPLIACAAAPVLWLTVILWVLSGACTAYQVQVITEFVHTVSPDIRGQGIALASGGLLAAQGIGLVAGGALAQLLTPAAAIAAAGALATVLAARLAAARRHDAGRSRVAEAAGALASLLCNEVRRPPVTLDRGW